MTDIFGKYWWIHIVSIGMFNEYVDTDMTSYKHMHVNPAAQMEVAKNMFWIHRCYSK